MKVLGRWKDSMLISAAGSQMLLAVVGSKTYRLDRAHRHSITQHTMSLGDKMLHPRRLWSLGGKLLNFS